MRLAMLILVWVVSIVFVAAHADESFTKVAVDGHEGYVVPEEYAQRQDSSVRMHLAGKLVEAEYRQVGFWTPTVEQVKEAEKTVRKFIRKGAANPKRAFPNVAAYPDKFIPGALLLSGKEIGLVDRDYDKYVRQFVGMLLGGRKLIYCSYFFSEHFAPWRLDPAKGFLDINDAGHAVWQVEYNISSRQCINLEINGPWDSGR